MRFAPQSKPMSDNARSVASFATLGGEGSAHAFLSSVILVCVGASPPSICEEPSSALFYFLSISFSFLLSNAVGVPSHCDRSAAASVAVRGCDYDPSMKSAGSLFCCRFLAVSDAVRRAVVVRLPGQGWRVLFSIPCCRNRMPCEGVVIRLPPPMKSAWEVCPVPDPLPQAVVVWKRYCRCHPMESRQRDVPDSAGRVECGVWRACPIVGLGGGVFYTMVGCLAWKSACTTCRSAGVRAGRLCGWQRGAACGGCGLLPFGLAALRLSFFVPLSLRTFWLVSVCSFALSLPT